MLHRDCEYVAQLAGREATKIGDDHRSQEAREVFVVGRDRWLTVLSLHRSAADRRAMTVPEQPASDAPSPSCRQERCRAGGDGGSGSRSLGLIRRVLQRHRRNPPRRALATNANDHAIISRFGWSVAGVAPGVAARRRGIDRGKDVASRPNDARTIRLVTSALNEW